MKHRLLMLGVVLALWAVNAPAGACKVVASETTKTWRYARKATRGEVVVRWIPFGYAHGTDACRPAQRIA